ncbi:MAG: Ig-like domain-containing protein [Gammaproteobacteria bacterium]|nr:Ig-like domain-containing protein [Gammaproteobacteria bacterium]
MLMLGATVRAEVLFATDNNYPLSAPNDVAVSQDGLHVYVARLLSNTIEVLSRNTVMGDLTPVETITGDPGLMNPLRIKQSPDGQFVYVISHGSNVSEPDSLLVYRRGTDGKLTYIEAAQNGSGGIADMSKPSDMAFSPSGDQLYVRAADSGSLLIFSRNISTGQLILLQALRDSDAGIDGLGGVGMLAVSADGFVYTTSITDNSVAVFRRDAGSGQLSLVKTYIDAIDGISGLLGAWSVALAPDDKHLYLAGGSSNTVVLFARDSVTGELLLQSVYQQGDANLTGDLSRSFDGLQGPIDLKVSPDGQRVYVNGSEDNGGQVHTLALMRRDLSDGSLSFMQVLRSSGIAPIDGLAGVPRFALSPDGRFLYSAATKDDKIGVFEHLTTDLGIVAVGESDPVDLGSTFSYTITVTNHSAFVTHGVAVTDTLPAEVGFVSVDDASCAHYMGIVKCELGTLAGGARKEIRIQVTAPLTEALLQNHAVVFSEYNDINPADNQDQESTTVRAPNTPPVAVDDVFESPPGETAVLDILANDEDQDGDALTILSVTVPESMQGTVSINAGSQVTYTPPASLNGVHYTGTETFSYRVQDSNGAEDEGQVTIVVNTPPVASDDAVTVVQGIPVTIWVLINDSDPDGNTIQIDSVDSSMLTSGSVQVNGDGTITYTSGESFIGTEIFSYALRDAHGAEAQANVTIAVQAITDNGGGTVDTGTTATDKKGGGGAISNVFIFLLLTLSAIRFFRKAPQNT